MPTEVKDIGLVVHNNPNSDEHHLMLKGSSVAGEGSSLAVGYTNKTAQIATINTGGNGQGDLIFRVKDNSTNSGALPDYLRRGNGGLQSYMNTIIRTSGYPDGNSDDSSQHQLFLHGDDYQSVGLALGTSKGVAWSIYADIDNSVTHSKHGDLIFKKPMTATHSTYVDVLTLTKENNVKVAYNLFTGRATIGTGYQDPQHTEKLHVSTEAAIDSGNGGALRLRKNANSWTYIDDGDELGEITFGSGNFSALKTAKILGIASGNWSNGYYPTEMQFFTHSSDGMVKRMTISDKSETHKQIVATNGLYSHLDSRSQIHQRSIRPSPILSKSGW